MFLHIRGKVGTLALPHPDRVHILWALRGEKALPLRITNGAGETSVVAEFPTLAEYPELENTKLEYYHTFDPILLKQNFDVTVPKLNPETERGICCRTLRECQSGEADILDYVCIRRLPKTTPEEVRTALHTYFGADIVKAPLEPRVEVLAERHMVVKDSKLLSYSLNGQPDSHLSVGSLLWYAPAILGQRVPQIFCQQSTAIKQREVGFSYSS